MKTITLTICAIIHLGYIGSTVYLPSWASSVAMLTIGYSLLVPAMWYHHTHSPLTRTQHITLNSTTMLLAIISNAISANVALIGFIVSSVCVAIFPFVFRLLSRLFIQGSWDGDNWVCPPNSRLRWELGACRAKNGASYVVVPESKSGGEVVRLGWDVWVVAPSVQIVESLKKPV